MPADLTPEALHARMEGGDTPLVVDVRSRAEFTSGHVPGAVHVPFWAMLWRAGRLPVPRTDPVIVYCGHGPRARMAQSLLRLRGFTRVACLAGHMAGWRRAGFPVTAPAPPRL
jgi:rhodanese-related sulfurtransferase